ncbi:MULTISPECIES: YveK family protein [Microbispora]|uniref:Wzz/FepE/Etk N-terminal domain-containing protein n=1 Tax=Microbispora hainanensis TaxID=568844 RepID=A0ABZ1SR45_9ACTN|nr:MULTISPECIES: Wzz/FepE/Etk N-terminal domain-containing protein [Microbispora]
MSLPPHSRDLAEYGSVLRRRRLVAVICLLAGVGGGTAALVLTPPRYTATAQVQVTATGAQEQFNVPNSRQREILNLDTESQIARSAVVSTLAAAILKYPDPEELRERLTVDVPPNSAVLSISYSASDPRAAAAGAQAYAEAYLRNRARAAEDAIGGQLRLIAARLHQIEDDLEKAGTTTTTTAGQATSRRQALLARQAADLTLRYDALKTVAVTPGTVISPARPPARPSYPSPPLFLGSGLFLGVLAGAGAAFCRDRLDTRIRTCADIERLCGLPLLAELPARPSSAALDEMAAAVATSLGGGPHRLLVEGVGTGILDGGRSRRQKGSRAARQDGAGSGGAGAGGAGAGRQDGTGAQGKARLLAKSLGPALAHLVPVTVVTGRSAHPDAAVLLVGLRRTTSPEVTRAVRQLARQGARVLGAVAVPPGFVAPVPETAEWGA